MGTIARYSWAHFLLIHDHHIFSLRKYFMILLRNDVQLGTLSSQDFRLFQCLTQAVLKKPLCNLKLDFGIFNLKTLPLVRPQLLGWKKSSKCNPMSPFFILNITVNCCWILLARRDISLIFWVYLHTTVFLNAHLWVSLSFFLNSLNSLVVFFG